MNTQTACNFTDTPSQRSDDLTSAVLNSRRRLCVYMRVTWMNHTKSRPITAYDLYQNMIFTILLSTKYDFDFCWKWIMDNSILTTVGRHYTLSTSPLSIRRQNVSSTGRKSIRLYSIFFIWHRIAIFGNISSFVFTIVEYFMEIYTREVVSQISNHIVMEVSSGR